MSPRALLCASLALLAPIPACSATTASPTPSSASAEPEPAQTPPGDAGADAPTEDLSKTPEATKLADELTTFLTGRFDSKDQSVRDTSYFAITLAVCAASAPAIGARALYVEQAREGDRPYRQRLYVVEPIDATTARSRVFELKSASKVVGACDAAQAPTFAPGDVDERVGCEVVLTRVPDRFRGHTPDARWDGQAFVPDPAAAKCPSTLQGASYATSQVDLLADRMVSWDRGFDDAGRQVWGATKGGYEFLRRSAKP
jgi:hypothetical protein